MQQIFPKTQVRRGKGTWGLCFGGLTGKIVNTLTSHTKLTLHSQPSTNNQKATTASYCTVLPNLFSSLPPDPRSHNTHFTVDWTPPFFSHHTQPDQAPKLFPPLSSQQQARPPRSYVTSRLSARPLQAPVFLGRILGGPRARGVRRRTKKHTAP